MLAALGWGACAQAGLASDIFLERERPTRTRSTVAVYPGEIVIEGGAAFEREGSFEGLGLGEVALRFGIYESVELRVDLGTWRRLKRDGAYHEGYSDAGLSVKVEVRDYSSGWIPESALLAGLRVPSGDRRVGGDRDGGFALLALAWRLGPELSITGNAGLARPDTKRGRLTQARASAALAWKGLDPTTLFAEIFALSEDAESTRSSLRVGVGASHLLSERVAIDLRIERGSSGEDPDFLVGAGISFRF